VGLGMDSFERALEVHPFGEVEKGDLDGLAVDTHGRRIYVEWDPASPVTPLGQLVFFSHTWRLRAFSVNGLSDVHCVSPVRTLPP